MKIKKIIPGNLVIGCLVQKTKGGKDSRRPGKAIAVGIVVSKIENNYSILWLNIFLSSIAHIKNKIKKYNIYYFGDIKYGAHNMLLPANSKNLERMKKDIESLKE